MELYKIQYCTTYGMAYSLFSYLSLTENYSADIADATVLKSLNLAALLVSDENHLHLALGLLLIEFKYGKQLRDRIPSADSILSIRRDDISGHLGNIRRETPHPSPTQILLEFLPTSLLAAMPQNVNSLMVHGLDTFPNGYSQIARFSCSTQLEQLIIFLGI
jgi:hypothetical protein